MAATRKTKPRADEFREAIESYLLENGDRVWQLLDESAARGRDEAWLGENRARLLQEEQWFGPKPPPDRRPRVVATKSFQHRGNEVPIGSIWLKDHDVVRCAPTAFADVVED